MALRALRACALPAILGVLASRVDAFEGRLGLPPGSSPTGLRVAVVGRTGSIPVSDEGRFRIVPDPSVPFVLAVLGAGSERAGFFEVREIPPSGIVEIPVGSGWSESVSVVAGLAPHVPSPPANASALIGAADLVERHPQHLLDALDGVAGTSQLEEGASAAPVIRGLSRGRTLVLLDGARLASERRAGSSATFLDASALGSIEIVRGPGSVAWGSDALGGVIDARPREPVPGTRRLDWELWSSHFGADRRSAVLGGSFDLFGGAIVAQAHIRDADESRDGRSETIADSSYRDRGGSLRWSRDTAAGQWTVGLAADEAKDAGKPALDSHSTRGSNPRDESIRATLAFEARPPAGWDRLSSQFFWGTSAYVSERDRFAAGSQPRRLLRSDVEASDAAARVVAVRGLFGGELKTGIDAVGRFGLHSTTETLVFRPEGGIGSRTRETTVEEARRIDGGVFVIWRRALGPRLAAFLGVRGDEVRTENRDGWFGDRSTSHGALSGQAALTIRCTENLEATLQLARGFRDPLLSDRYFRGVAGRGYVTGNPDLAPETSLQWDGALRFRRGGGSVALFGYLYRIEDLVERYSIGEDLHYRNRGHAELRGIELEAETREHRGLSVRLAAAVARGEADDGGDLDDLAPDGGSLSLRWSGGFLSAFARLRAFARSDRPGPTERDRAGWATADAGAGWRVKEWLEIRLLARNLSDRRYAETASATSPLAEGRSLSVGVVGRY